jgi:hypothetical protein
VSLLRSQRNVFARVLGADQRKYREGNVQEEGGTESPESVEWVWMNCIEPGRWDAVVSVSVEDGDPRGRRYILVIDPSWREK